MDINFDVENTRRMLIAKRVAAGAETPIGHRCSNLIEQIQNFQSAAGEQRTHLAAAIEKSMTELAELESRNKAMGE